MSRATRWYFAAPVAVQHLMISAYGVRLRRLRYGGEHRTYLATLREREWQRGKAMAQTQLAALNGVLRHARATVPFYRDRLPNGDLQELDAIATLPILTKAEVRRAERTLVSRSAGTRRLLEIHTGGTTGTPLTIFCDRATLRRNYAFFVRFQESAGIASGSAVATFAGRTIVPPDQQCPPFWRRNFAGNALLCSSYHISPDTLPAYAEALARFQPSWLDSYPSSLAPIARYLLSGTTTRVRPQAIITSSETLLPEMRQLLTEAFQCPVFDHYGAAEMTAFITQCRMGAYHANPEYGVVEILRDGVPVRPGETGEIVATGFINPVMPFIRYATGDLAVRGEGPCPCGRASPILERIVGRMDDVLITPEGRSIGRLDPIFKAVSSLVETRIVQDARDHVRVEMVSEGDIAPAACATLLTELQHRLGPSMRIDLVRVPRLPREASGKVRAVVNLVFPGSAAHARTKSHALPHGDTSA